MFPPVWGPVFWQTIHILTITTHLTLAPEVITTLCLSLPCPSCSVHAREYLEKHPINANSRDELIDWAITFHNAVNTRLEKPVLSIENGRAAILNFLNKQLESQQTANKIQRPNRHKRRRNMVIFSISFVIVCFIIIVWIQRRRYNNKAKKK